MRDSPLILAADDDAMALDILQTRLQSQGYDVLTAVDGERALAMVRAHAPDLVLLDVMMPGLDGVEVCRRIRAEPGLPFIPIILITALGESQDVVAGLESGADEYLTKPVDSAALVARVRSMLRIKHLHDTMNDQVHQQVQELERLSQLRRFLSPQLAEMIVAGREEHLLESHRREVAVVFCQLAGFTAFAEAVEPEDVLLVLRDYHATVQALITAFEGTLERFAGHELMVLFNDPVPVADPALRAAHMALEMQRRVGELSASWANRGHDLRFVAGLAMGYATLGTIGSASQLAYAAVGSVTDLATRLCEVAAPGQVLASQRASAALAEQVDMQPVGPLDLRGFSRPVAAYWLQRLKSETTGAARTDSPLSAREQEVAACVARGLTNREIAEALVISERTVASHIEHILDKLAFASRTQIGVWAAGAGLARQPGD